MLYPQNGDRVVTTGYVTSRRPVYTSRHPSREQQKWTSAQCNLSEGRIAAFCHPLRRRMQASAAGEQYAMHSSACRSKWVATRHMPPSKWPFLCEGNREWRKSRFSLKAIVSAVLRSTAHTCDQLTLKCDLRRKDPHPRGPKTKNRPLIYAFESRLICKTRDLTCCSAGCRAVLTNGNTGHVPRAIGFFFFLRGPQLAVVK